MKKTRESGCRTFQFLAAEESGGKTDDAGEAAIELRE